MNPIPGEKGGGGGGGGEERRALNVNIVEKGKGTLIAYYFLFCDDKRHK